MNPFALTFVVFTGLMLFALLLAAGAHVFDTVLTAPQRWLLVGVSYAAGFFTCILAVLLRA